VQLNAAIFYTNYANRLYLFQQLAEKQIIDLTTNVGTSKNYGVEFDISAPLPDGFKVSAGMGYLRAKWGDVPNYINPATSQAINIKGLTVPFAPAVYGQCHARVEATTSAGYEFGSRATTSFVGRSYWDPQTRPTSGLITW